jgi:hypothetical protein
MKKFSSSPHDFACSGRDKSMDPRHNQELGEVA